MYVIGEDDGLRHVVSDQLWHSTFVRCQPHERFDARTPAEDDHDAPPCEPCAEYDRALDAEW